jgi:hypothetical protein
VVSNAAMHESAFGTKRASRLCGTLSAFWGKAGIAAAISPATKSSPSAACCTTATTILTKIVHILAPIIVGDFLAWLDSAQCHDHDPTPSSDWFCIRPTGMIDVTGHVPSRRAIDRPSLVELELIFGAACLTSIRFLGGNAPAAIGRNIDPSLNWLCRKQTESCERTANPKSARRHWFVKI